MKGHMCTGAATHVLQVFNFGQLGLRLDNKKLEIGTEYFLHSSKALKQYDWLPEPKFTSGFGSGRTQKRIFF